MIFLLNATHDITLCRAYYFYLKLFQKACISTLEREKFSPLVKVLFQYSSTVINAASIMFKKFREGGRIGGQCDCLE